ncbi:hypothetical protein BOO69_16250 [Sulfitobacter alexandrii]|uniref:Uncharacterized protein n=1 Tax=Sulfitobacter alexandrii TaxID=1917485 RepID=A0A1J0WKB3_9RHOB|nr:hypothetical protein [Sulfitobacter alexandrii]APE44777.1 hypothetical protein BOO69_16250 [Sulfitobacter alexandrii]
MAASRNAVMGVLAAVFAGPAFADMDEAMQAFLDECLPVIEEGANPPESERLVTDTHVLRWRTLAAGGVSCIVAFRDDYVLPDDRRAEERAGRRSKAEAMTADMPGLVEKMQGRGYEVCADQANQDEELNLVLRKSIDEERAVSAVVWGLPSFPIAAMNAGLARKDELVPCETEMS